MGDTAGNGTTDVLDIWVNWVTKETASDFLQQEGYEHIPDYLGSSGTGGIEIEQLVALMDDQGVATGILCAGLDRSAERSLAVADAHPGRFLVAGGFTTPERPGRNVRRIRELAEHPRFSMVRIMPLTTQVPINDARCYPVYQVCEELGIPVGINVGIPGPRVRSACQHPSLLEDVLIDFPDLVVMGAHMGHPFEELLMNYMRKWPNLYLSCTAYAPRYLVPGLVEFMNTKTYRGRMIWGSDEPWFPMVRSLAEARALPLDDEAMALFLGGTARRLFDRT